MKTLTAIVAAVLALLLPAVALAAEPTPPSPDDPLALLKAAADAAGAHNWLLFIPLVLVGLIWAVRQLAGTRLPWLKTDRGGAVLALATALLTTLAAVGMTPGPHTFSSVLSAMFALLLANKTLFDLLRKALAPSGAEAAKDVVTTANAAGDTAQAQAKTPESAASAIVSDLK